AEVVRQLSSLDTRRLGVISGASSTQYAQQGKALDQIGRELGADFLVEATVLRVAAKLRVNARLIRVRDQVDAWAQTYEGTASDTLSFQAEVALWLAGAVEGIVLVPSES